MPDIDPCRSAAHYVHPAHAKGTCGGDKGPAETVEAQGTSQQRAQGRWEQAKVASYSTVGGHSDSILASKPDKTHQCRLACTFSCARYRVPQRC